jgi:3-hydroxyisobutyrate dehydrogenase-like beta-hydroxyacid dehydrogenase
VLPSLADLAHECDLIIAVVPPASAVEVARRYCSHAIHAPAGVIYIDVTPLTPPQKREMAGSFAACGVRFVDGAICGSASHLRTLGRIYLSGEAAAEVEGRLANSTVPVKSLGRRPGQAALLKMFMGGMSKGLAMLFLEMTVAARQALLLDDVLDCYGHFYAGLMPAIERMLPTYPAHAARRADELREVEETMQQLDLTPRVTAGVREMLEAVATIEPSESRTVGGGVRRVIEQVHAGLTSQENHSTLEG